MDIRIHLPRPILTVGIVVVGLLWWNGVFQFHWNDANHETNAKSEGGQHPAETITAARQDIDRERVKQAVLERREETLRSNLQILEEQALTTASPEDQRKLSEARAVLLGIIKQRDQSEKLLMLSLEQLWEAEGTAYSLQSAPGDTVIQWPVKPSLGISAFFEDLAYEKRFGFPHHAIDIPTAQGTEIAAPIDGVILKVSLNGLGYSSITMQSANGLEMIFGHISRSNVAEGDRVTEGQVIGSTGGQPGTEGAGLHTTGPHLHFALRKDGVLVNPMKYLPSISR